MNDHTRGEAPGTGQDTDAPLKRDRKRLRSSEASSARTQADADSSAAEVPDRPEAHESERSPVEELFAGQWTSSLPAPGAPASTIPPEPMAIPHLDVPAHGDVDLTEDDSGAAPAVPTKRRFGLDSLKKTRGEDADPLAEEPGAGEAAEPSAGGPAPTAPYVPPGGFTGPGHPRLGPIAPVPTEQHRGLAGLDIAAIVAAVIVPPIGLVTAIVAIIRGKKLRGWASDLARAAVSVSLVMTVVFVGVGGFIWVQETERAEQLAAVKAEQRAHDLVATASQPFCGVLAENPTIYSTADPDHGWPAVDAAGGYNAAIAQYAAVWAQLAEVAPEGIAEETAAISARVAGIVNISNALGSTNRAGDLLGLHQETDLATVESWYIEYCDAPEIPVE